MKAVILAGGSGSRLREVIRDVPKPMAPVGGKPFLEYLIMQLVKWDIRDIVLSIGYKGDIVESYFGNGDRWGATVQYSQEEKPLGTGGAVREALRFIEEDDFILVNGDSFADLDFHKLVAFHIRHGGPATMGLVFLPDTSRYGKVEIDNEGKVLSFTEKSGDGKGLINCGVYILHRKSLGEIPAGNVSFEREILPGLVPLGIYGISEKTFFIDIGIPRDYSYICKHPNLLKFGNTP